MANLLSMETCPYNPSHRIDAKKLSVHIMKCRKNYKGVNMETCPFNATHIVPAHLFKAHIVECPEKDVVLKSLVSFEENDDDKNDTSDTEEEDEDFNWSSTISKIEANAVDEVWTPNPDIFGKFGGYDAETASLLKPFPREVPTGLSKKARQQWRVFDQKRVEELKDGVPFSSEVRAALKIPPHIDTDPHYVESGITPYFIKDKPMCLSMTSIDSESSLQMQPLRRVKFPRTTAVTCVAAAQQSQEEKSKGLEPSVRPKQRLKAFEKIDSSQKSCIDGDHKKFSSSILQSCIASESDCDVGDVNCNFADLSISRGDSDGNHRTFNGWSSVIERCKIPGVGRGVLNTRLSSLSLSRNTDAAAYSGGRGVLGVGRGISKDRFQF